MTVEQAYQILYGGALIVFLLMIGAMVIRSIIGPRSTDRILSVNMLGTMTICSIALLSYLLGEGYLADVALIYAMISFVAVLMMASMFVVGAAIGKTVKNVRDGMEGKSAEAAKEEDEEAGKESEE